MARVIIKTETRPYKMKEGDKQNICMCGLSDNQPFCNGSHVRTTSGEKQGKLYEYQEGKPVEVEIKEK